MDEAFLYSGSWNFLSPEMRRRSEAAFPDQERRVRVRISGPGKCCARNFGVWKSSRRRTFGCWWLRNSPRKRCVLPRQFVGVQPKSGTVKKVPAMMPKKDGSDGAGRRGRTNKDLHA